MKLTSQLRSTALVGIAGLFMAFLPAANAGILHTQGWANQSQQFGLSIGGSPQAGGFRGTWEGDEIYFWCIELTQFFSFGNNYSDYVPSVPDGATVTLLGQLFNEAFDVALSSPTNSAAFQLAIWEIIYDPDLNLGAGDFKVTKPYANGATVAVAQSWLDGLSSTGDIELIFLSSEGPRGHQDFVTFGRTFDYLSVPEPNPLLLVGTAFFVMLLATRRKVGARRVRKTAAGA